MAFKACWQPVFLPAPSVLRIVLSNENSAHLPRIPGLLQILLHNLCCIWFSSSTIENEPSFSQERCLVSKSPFSSLGIVLAFVKLLLTDVMAGAGDS